MRSDPLSVAVVGCGTGGPAAALLLAQAGHVVEVFERVRWHGDGIAFVGDSGHAMSPQLGQGVNLALLDALVLARALEEHAALPAALAATSPPRRAGAWSGSPPRGSS